MKLELSEGVECFGGCLLWLNKTLLRGKRFHWILSGWLALTVVSGGCAQRQYETPIAPYRYRKGKKLRGVIHTVRKGETLWRIAKAYKLRLDYLAKINRIKDFSKVKAGKKLFIPGVKRIVRVLPVQSKAGTKKSYAKKVSLPKVSSKRWYLKEKSLVWPVKGKLTSGFGMRWDSKHEGIDIAAPIGAEVKAAGAGKVIYSDNKMRYYGNVIIIKHRGGYFSIYAHNSVNLVNAGDIVKQGQVIAKAGQSGRATGPHLHFEIRQGDRPVDPLPFLPPR